MPDFSVNFTKYVNVCDTVHVNKDFNVSAYVKGTSAIGQRHGRCHGLQLAYRDADPDNGLKGMDRALFRNLYLPSY